MRALEPQHQGRVEVDGVGGYEVFGSGDRTILFAPAWAIVNSRIWKAQVPYLAQRYPRDHVRHARHAAARTARRTPRHYAATCATRLAVLEATETERALLVGLSLGAATVAVHRRPAARARRRRGGDRPDRAAARRPATRGGAAASTRTAATRAGRASPARSWRRDYPGFVEFFLREIFQEPPLREAGRGRRRLGPRRRPRRCSSARWTRRGGYTSREEVEALVAARALPGARHPRGPRPHHAARAR